MKTTHRGCALALALVASALTGCGGGSSGSGGTCQRAAVPATGPGDTLHYFPAEVGRSWTYGVTGTDLGTPVPQGTTSVVSVTGTQVVGGETASLFTTSSGSEQVVKRPAGVYVLADPSVGPPLDQLYPSLVLPFPVAPTARALQVQCTDIDLGDLDGDMKNDRGDITAYLSVISVTETTTNQAGAFTDVAHVITDATVTVRATSLGGNAVTIQATEDDLYAKDVGRVVSRLQMSSSGIALVDETQSLTSYIVPPAGVAPPRALAQLAAAADLAEPPADGAERAAMRIARQLVSAGR